MKKVFKVIGILVAVCVGLVLLFFAFVWGSLEWNRYSKKKEAIRMQKEVCDTITTTDGNFPLNVSGFTHQELKKIKFYQKRNKYVIKDTTIKFVPEKDQETQTVIMPFKLLHIKDEIIVVIANRTYLISGFSYIAAYNYGMFGPVGSCECRPTSYENVNGKPGGSGWLLKKEGMLNYQLPLKENRI